MRADSIYGMGMSRRLIVILLTHAGSPKSHW